MMPSTMRHSNDTAAKRPSGKWKRLILLLVLGYEAAGCLAGGVLLIITPDGSAMKMPVSIMHGFFRDFLIPGIILFCLGVLNTVAFISVWRKTGGAKQWSIMAVGGLTIWFLVEIAVLQALHWLHAMWGLPVVLGALMIVLLYPRQYTRK